MHAYCLPHTQFKLIPHTNLGGFQPATARFYGGSVVLCLQYLHKMNVAYRDLKVRRASTYHKCCGCLNHVHSFSTWEVCSQLFIDLRVTVVVKVMFKASLGEFCS
eukprot:TRINITY_DN6068_c0_g1_i2.p1 TRINITY_DN6068_c0_g1~~TRINITY_DN6068_c0_g1_i2.p1  ORF type:complete len:105 (-),score=0.30 TRINITY_DN6068_c0_g1_i2:252-566(-)